ncbi:hypothetical protein ACFRAR_19350 [Kitasatospora sp. NPDC056651]|uniref:hypothetical protein n=1 Tax=Kitasatospora sp. NPDC056651 TaxID=3345892 RepID=UPI003673E4AB
MSTYDVLVVLPPMPPEQYREALVAALMPYHSELEVAPYREYEPADPNSVYWVRMNRESGLLPNREGMGWAEIADLKNSAAGRAPGDPGHLYVDEAGRWSDLRDDGCLRDANAYVDTLDPEAVVLDVCCHC